MELSFPLAGTIRSADLMVLNIASKNGLWAHFRRTLLQCKAGWKIHPCSETIVEENWEARERLSVEMKPRLSDEVWEEDPDAAFGTFHLTDTAVPAAIRITFCRQVRLVHGQNMTGTVLDACPAAGATVFVYR
jgi:hypothetical protein